MKKQHPLLVSEIIQKAIDATDSIDNLRRAKVCFLWGEITGPTINAHTYRRFVDDNAALHVFIDSAVIKNELSFARTRLLNHINNTLGPDTISAIIIH